MEFMAATAYRMVDAVAATLESFYKPELDAAHNLRCGSSGQPSAHGV
jgi:hypothetical protein